MVSAKRSATYIPLALGANSRSAHLLRAKLAPTGRQATRGAPQGAHPRRRWLPGIRRGPGSATFAPTVRQVDAIGAPALWGQW